MNKTEHADEVLLRQVDNLLEHNQTSASPLLNDLAHLTPQADPDFQSNLENRLVARLQKHTSQMPLETYTPMTTLKPPTKQPARSWLSWVAVAAIAFLGGVLLTVYRSPQLEALPMPINPVTRTIVIATQNIRPGTTITEEMIASITLSGRDYAELQNSQPEHVFSSDPVQVIGGVAKMSMRAFEPFDPAIFTLGAAPCPQHTTDCLLVPEGYSTIVLPAPSRYVQTLVVGDRVDVLQDSNNQYALLVDNVILVNKQDDKVTLAAPGWKHSVLVSLASAAQNYTLRLYDGKAAPIWDDTLVDQTIPATDFIPEGQQFDLFLRFPIQYGSMLTNAPYSLEDLPFTESGEMLNFWFKNVTIIRQISPTTVQVRMAQSDAANLDFLLAVGGTLSFVPDTSAPQVQAEHTQISLPAPETMPETDKVDIRLRLPLTQKNVLNNLPYSFDEAFPLETGDALNIWLKDVTPLLHAQTPDGASSSEYAITIQTTSHDGANLLYLIEQGASVDILPANSASVLIDPGYVAIALPVSGALPETERFDVVLSLPGSQLDAMTYPLEEVVSRTNGETLEFWLVNVEPLKISTVEVFANELTAVTLQVTPNDAVSLTHLIESGAEIRYLPANSAPQIPAARTEISLPAPEIMPQSDKVDIRVRLPLAQRDILNNLPYSFDQAFPLETDDSVLFWFVHVTPQALGTSAYKYTVTIQTTTHDAANLQYLLDHGATVDILGINSSPLMLGQGIAAVAVPAYDPLPETEQFDVVMSVRKVDSDVDASLPVGASPVPMRVNGDTLEYWLSDVKPLGITSMDAIGINPEPANRVVLLGLPVEDAMVVDYMMTIGAEVRFLPAGSMMPLIDQGNVVISLPAPDKLPDSPEFDILWRTSISQEQFDKDLPHGLDQMEMRLNGDGLELRLTKVTPLSAEILQSLGIDPASQSNMISLQVKPYDALAIEYLVNNAAPMSFQPAGQATESEAAQ